MKNLSLALAAALAVSAPASLAQMDHASHGASSFPETCKSAASMSPMGHGEANTAGLQDHQKAAMAGMQKMDEDMMQGMMKDDADVAFICGMIAHHQGAIDMARVELQYGDDPWAKEMARKVIDAQTKEIEDMIEWLGSNAK